MNYSEETNNWKKTVKGIESQVLSADKKVKFYVEKKKFQEYQKELEEIKKELNSKMLSITSIIQNKNGESRRITI